jgi:hypothetical protein
MRRETRHELLRHNFTPEEMAEKAQVVAQSYQRLAGAKKEKAAAASQYAERIKSEEALLGKTTREMSQGWETRPITCKIIYNLPNTGIKTIMRADTGDIVKTESMGQDELQETLFVDPAESEDPDKAVEDNVRSFFGLSAKAPSDVKAGEVSAWKQGDWIVVAASAEFAQQWMELKGHAEGLEQSKWAWCDPDTTIIKGLESFFGTYLIPVRRAIVHMENEGIAFPMLLQIPEDYMKKLHEGKDPAKAEPEAPAPEAEDKPAKKPRAPRKPKAPKGEAPAPSVEPSAPDQENTEGFGVDLGEDEDDDDDDDEKDEDGSLEPA